MHKRRITVTIDAAVYDAAVAAVEAGRAESVSGWVNEVLSERQAEERRLDAMADAVAFYEATTGREITDDDIAETELRDQESAAAVRSHRQRRAG